MKIKKTIVAVMSFALAAVLSFSGCGCGFGGETGKDSSDITDSVGSDVGTELPGEDENPGLVAEDGGSYAMPQVMTFTSASLAAANSAGVSVSLTATVLPEDAPDKSVDWSVAWLVPVEGEEVTDYVTVTPTSDGSNVATVTAYQAFEDASIIITVTTRVGGFTATCTVLYEGVPEYLDFVFEGEAYSSTQEIEVTTGQTYSAEIRSNNALGEAGSKYDDFEIFEIGMQGRFNATKELIVNGSVTKTESIVIDLESPTFYAYDVASEGNGELVTIPVSEFIDISLSGNILTLKPKKTESAYVYGSNIRTGTRVTYESAYYDPRGGGSPDDCQWIVYVREKTSGLECMIRVDIFSAVTGVDLSDSTLEF